MTTTNTKPASEVKSWLWPDRTIGKMESRILRDEHNAAVNEVTALRARCERLEAALTSILTTLDGWADGARIAALSAEQRGDDDEQVGQSNTRENYGKLVNIGRAALAGEGKS